MFISSYRFSSISLGQTDLPAHDPLVADAPTNDLSRNLGSMPNGETGVFVKKRTPRGALFLI